MCSVVDGLMVDVTERLQRFQGISHAENVKEILERQKSRIKTDVKKQKKKKGFTYLGDRVSAGGGCEAARTRCGWVKLKECAELLYGRRFPLNPKGAVYRRYVRSAI